MNLLDGKALAEKIALELKEETAQWVNSGGKVPHLAAILVGDDGASQTYVNHKIKKCELVGFKSTLRRFDSDVSEDVLLAEIDSLNKDNDIDGFIVQLPLPKHINSESIVQAIDHKKDVDGFHPENVGRMSQNLPAFISATPYGILELLRRYKIETSGKHCVVVGRSNIVGRPMSILMSRNTEPGNATVTICHSRTKDLGSFTQKADILIVALGKPLFIKASDVKEGAVVIDVGITRVEDTSKRRGYALKGDVDFTEVASKCSFITPVPGGVGPLTVCSLLNNTLLACKEEIYKK